MPIMKCRLMVLVKVMLALLMWAMGVSPAMVAAAVEIRQNDDLACLKEFKASVTDPLGYLNNWDFRGGADTKFCNFVGVSCLNSDQPEVHRLNLAGAGLRGRIPRALSKCSRLKGLDLSSNFFTGRIPPTARLCWENPQLVWFDLSNNAFSGTYATGVQTCPRSSQSSASDLPTSSLDDNLELRSSDTDLDEKIHAD